MDGPGWVILLMYGSHDMRHIGSRRLTVVNETPGFGASQHGIRAMVYKYLELDVEYKSYNLVSGS